MENGMSDEYLHLICTGMVLGLTIDILIRNGEIVLGIVSVQKISMLPENCGMVLGIVSVR
jgi:hypothetical protein